MGCWNQGAKPRIQAVAWDICYSWGSSSCLWWSCTSVVWLLCSLEFARWLARSCCSSCRRRRRRRSCRIISWSIHIKHVPQHSSWYVSCFATISRPSTNYFFTNLSHSIHSVFLPRDLFCVACLCAAECPANCPFAGFLGPWSLTKLFFCQSSSTFLRNYSCHKIGGWNVAKWMKLSFPWSTIGEVGVFIYY